MDDGITESAGDGVDGVVVGGVGDDVEFATFAAESVLAESDGAIGEALAVELPAGVAAPAVIDWVAGQAAGLVVACVGYKMSSC